MPMTHVLCAIDFFGLAPGGDGSGSAFRLEGWHLSHAATRSIALVLADADGRETEIEVDERDLPDTGVMAAHGHEFGKSSARARFRLVAPLPAGPEPFDGRLLVALEHGVRLRYPLGAPKMASEADPAPPPEDVALVARFLPCGDAASFGRLRHALGIDGGTAPDGAGGTDAFALAARIERRLADPPEDEGARAARRAFLAALDDDASVFVFEARHGGRGGQIGMERLYEAFRAAGRARLLWVTGPVPGRASGTVVRVRTGLLHGTVEAMDAEASEREGWLAMLRAAVTVLEPAAP